MADAGVPYTRLGKVISKEAVVDNEVYDTVEAYKTHYDTAIEKYFAGQ
jgi:hypothetical protein